MACLPCTRPYYAGEFALKPKISSLLLRILFQFLALFQFKHSLLFCLFSLCVPACSVPAVISTPVAILYQCLFPASASLLPAASVSDFFWYPLQQFQQPDWISNWSTTFEYIPVLHNLLALHQMLTMVFIRECLHKGYNRRSSASLPLPICPARRNHGWQAQSNNCLSSGRHYTERSTGTLGYYGYLTGFCSLRPERTQYGCYSAWGSGIWLLAAA